MLSDDSTNAKLEAFFRGQPLSRQIFDALRGLIDELGPAEVAVTKSQVAFRRAQPFAWAWMPGQYLRGRRVAPLVLSLALPQRDPSPRWKQVVEPRPGRWMHHLERYTATDLDGEVRAWLREAWEQAG